MKKNSAKSRKPKKPNTKRKAAAKARQLRAAGKTSSNSLRPSRTIKNELRRKHRAEYKKQLHSFYLAALELEHAIEQSQRSKGIIATLKDSALANAIRVALKLAARDQEFARAA